MSGSYEVGGLVGYDLYNGRVSNCYSTGSVLGGSEVGGLVGWNYGIVSNCYSTGSVSGNTYVGGLIGRKYYGTVSNSFWDNQTSGQSTSSDGRGKTTFQMKDVRTYTDKSWSSGLGLPVWDFVGNPYGDVGNEDIWDINPDVNDGYPFLAAAATEGVPASNGPIPTRWPLIAGVVGVIVVISIVTTVYVRRR